MQIILVEDNKGDIYLIREALKEIQIDISLKTITDGADAIRCMVKDCERPDLIILDINLPHNDGFEVLTVIRKTEDKREVPVVVFTSSSSEDDKEKALNLGASKFISKPTGYYEYTSEVKSFVNLT